MASIDEKDLDETALIARRGPTVNDLEPASIGSKVGAVQVHNIKLWRDTYYTQNASSGADKTLSPADWSDPRVRLDAARTICESFSITRNNQHLAKIAKSIDDAVA